MSDKNTVTASRREYLAVAGSLTAAISVAGCLDEALGDEVEFEADGSRVSDDALEETGYEFDELSEHVIEREYEVGDETQDVVVTNKIAKYQKELDADLPGDQDAVDQDAVDQERAIFTSLTTPQVDVLGQEFNPVDEMSTDELAEMVQEEYDEVENLREEGESDVIIQGEETTQTKFRADAAYEGNPVELFLHVTEATEMEDDFVIAAGGYPVLTDEEDNILTLMEAIEPVE